MNPPQNYVFADRLSEIAPFRVMEVLARAQELEAEGHHVVHLEVGEPDFMTAQPIRQAGQQALEVGATRYTNAAGIAPLKQKISQYYQSLGVAVPPHRIIVTAGASGGLALLNALLLNPGDGLLMADPGYPCNEVFALTVGGVPQRLPVSANNGFQPVVQDVEEAWQPNTRGVLLASPANPTGAMLPRHALAEIGQAVHLRSGFVIVDEIYQGVTFEPSYQTALQVLPDAFVLNSFSKYFGMTGWRLGWLVVPDIAVDAVTKLAQNLVICPSAPAQHAALAAFEPAAMQIHEERVAAFARRMEVLYRGLKQLGFVIPVKPQGAFYLYVDVSHTGMDSMTFCKWLLDEHHVAVTPGSDFGDRDAHRYVRFAFTTSLEEIEVALRRLADALSGLSQ